MDVRLGSGGHCSGVGLTQILGFPRLSIGRKHRSQVFFRSLVGKYPVSADRTALVLPPNSSSRPESRAAWPPAREGRTSPLQRDFGADHLAEPPPLRCPRKIEYQIPSRTRSQGTGPSRLGHTEARYLLSSGLRSTVHEARNRNRN